MECNGKAVTFKNILFILNQHLVMYVLISLLFVYKWYILVELSWLGYRVLR